MASQPQPIHLLYCTVLCTVFKALYQQGPAVRCAFFGHLSQALNFHDLLPQLPIAGVAVNLSLRFHPIVRVKDFLTMWLYLHCFHNQLFEFINPCLIFLFSHPLIHMRVPPTRAFRLPVKTKRNLNPIQCPKADPPEIMLNLDTFVSINLSVNLILIGPHLV